MANVAPSCAMDNVNFRTAMYAAIRNVTDESTWCQAYNNHDYTLHTLWHVGAKQVKVFHFNFANAAVHNTTSLSEMSQPHIEEMQLDIEFTLHGKGPFIHGKS